MAKDGKPFHRGSMQANEDNPGIEAGTDLNIKVRKGI